MYIFITAYCTINLLNAIYSNFKLAPMINLELEKRYLTFFFIMDDLKTKVIKHTQTIFSPCFIRRLSNINYFGCLEILIWLHSDNNTVAVTCCENGY